MTDAIQMEKAKIRMQMVDRRARMHPDTRGAASKTIVARIAASDNFQRASALCCFSPLREEVQVMPLTHLADENGCKVFLPAFDEVDRVYRFRHWDLSVPLLAGRWNILEPQGTNFTILDGEVCVIVPGQAFDRSGMRIGYGGGYFDRMLREMRAAKECRVTAIGVAYAFQVLDRLPHDAKDQPVDMIVTESEWITTQKQGE